MTKQRGFTQEFEDEAVRLALTSGRTRRELAENLGVGLSTLTRWIARRVGASATIWCCWPMPGRRSRFQKEPMAARG